MPPGRLPRLQSPRVARRCQPAAVAGQPGASWGPSSQAFLVSCPPGEMVRQARILAQATSDLVNAIKADAEGETDLENSRKLLSAAKILADATAKMVEAAKGAAAHPDSEEQQQRLREA
ncbi:Talin-1, partial [Ophiophagus hannah]